MHPLVFILQRRAMRVLVFARLCAVVLAIPSEIAAAGVSVPLANPGFESNFTGWTLGNAGSITISGSAHTGSASASLDNSAGAASAYQMATQASTRGDDYTLIFWTKDNGSPPNSQWIASLIYLDNSNAPQVITSVTASETGSWTQYSVSYKVTGAEPWLGKPVGVHFAPGKQGIVLDDVTLDVIPALVAHWKLDEISGLTATDASGLNHDGALTGMTASWVTGKCGNGLQFDGINDEVIVADSDLLDATATLTVMLWCYPTVMDGNPRSPVCKRINYNNNNSWGVFFYTGNHVDVDLDGTGDRFATNTTFSANQWYHIAVVYDGTLATASRARIYVNGVLDKTATESSSVLPNLTGPVVLGHLNGNATGYFRGILDDVKIYRIAMTATEVTQAMDCATGTGTLSITKWREIVK